LESEKNGSFKNIAILKEKIEFLTNNQNQVNISNNSIFIN